MTGLLTRSFTVYYGVSNLSPETANDIDGTLGIVNIKDPIDTLQVESHINTT